MYQDIRKFTVGNGFLLELSRALRGKERGLMIALNRDMRQPDQGFTPGGVRENL